jgi:hypothetical protein
MALVVFTCACERSRAQAALLMEEPYGFFGFLNPTGHNAIYFERICAETPVKLRRCEPGEMGAVLSRYQGIDGYDWVAMPLVPYLYSVEEASSAPTRVDRETVTRLRSRYHEAHLLDLSENLPAGGVARGGWTELVGAAYERRIYALFFATAEEQDDALIAHLNADRNRSRFELFYSNCADFARTILDFYFPGRFRREIFPDAGMTTPKQGAWKLERYARAHPDTHLEIFEIPQIPGYRRPSHSNKDIVESLATTVYALPILLANPYIAGGIGVDYAVRGRHRIIPRHPPILDMDSFFAMRGASTNTAPTAIAQTAQNKVSAGGTVSSAAAKSMAEAPTHAATNAGLRGIKDNHE